MLLVEEDDEEAEDDNEDVGEDGPVISDDPGVVTVTVDRVVAG